MGRIENNPLYDLLYQRGIYNLYKIKKLCNSYFPKYKEIEKVYLVGSYAKGCACETSDLDFMVFFKEGLKYHRKQGILISNGKLHWWRGYFDMQIHFSKHIDLFDGDAMKDFGQEDYNEFMIKAKLVYKANGKEIQLKGEKKLINPMYKP